VLRPALALVALAPFVVFACGPKKDPIVIPGTGSASMSAATGPIPAPTYGPPTPPLSTSKIGFEKKSPALHDCYKAHKTGPDPVADADKLARTCEAATKMRPAGAPLRASQSDADPPRSFPLKADANKCYRLYVSMSSTITTLDVAIKDSDGNVVSSGSGDPLVVGEDSVVCFKKADAATISVAVGAGKGDIVVQVWSD
jgi:hypothetical protein